MTTRTSTLRVSSTAERLPRRQFLATCAAAAAAGATWFDVARLNAAQLKAEDPFGGLPLGVQSYSLRNFDLQQAVRHIQGLGLHFVEFYSKHVPLDIDAPHLAELRELLDKADLKISAHGVTGFTKDHEANRQVFEFAKRVGIRNITANPQPDSFDSLDKLVAEYDIRIAIHNHGPGALYDSLESVQKAVQGRHKWVGACVDTGHFIRSGVDPAKAVRELGPRVFAVHVKDEPKAGKASHNVVIGQGLLDVEELFRALKQVHFPADGSLSLEYEANPANPVEDMRACLDVAKAVIAKLVRA